MKQRILNQYHVAITVIGITALLSTILTGMASCVTEKAAGEKATVLTTRDIGHHFPSDKVEIESASFQPEISKKDALSTVRKILRQNFNVAHPESFPTETTVGLFSGETHDGRGKVSDIPVWIVVVKELPSSISPGSVPQGTAPGSHIQLGAPKYNVAIDAQTGAVVHSVINRKIIE
ncbi:MAG: hypothetical protein ACLFVK_01445 [Dehalococcoidia bacterium]